MIGEEIDYGRNAEKGFYRFTWLCCSLGIVVFSLLAYAGLIEQDIALGGSRGLPITYHVGSEAIFQGYLFFTFAYLCFAAGFWYWRFKYMIWTLLALIWVCCLFFIHAYIS